MSRSSPDFFAVLATLMALGSGCRQMTNEGQRRSSRAASASGDVVVGVVWPLPDPRATQEGTQAEAHDGRFWQGVDIASSRIEAEGGVLGRKLRLIRAEDDGTIARGKAVAQQLAEDLDVVAVLGYREPNVATVTSIMFEYANVVMIALGPSGGRLTRDGFHRVFRTLPTDEELASSLAGYAQDNGLKEILIAYENELYGRGIANAFEARVEENRISVVERIAFDRGATRGFEQRLKNVRGMRLDAVLLAARLPEAKEIIVALRKEGIAKPILGAGGLDSTALLGIPEAAGTVVASVFHPDAGDPETRAFAKAYREAYRREPDTWAAQGHDGVRLLAEAVKRGKASTPEAIAGALQEPEPWRGATGPFRFTERGDVIERRVVFKRVQDGKFELVSGRAREAARSGGQPAPDAK